MSIVPHAIARQIAAEIDPDRIVRGYLERHDGHDFKAISQPNGTIVFVDEHEDEIDAEEIAAHFNTNAAQMWLDGQADIIVITESSIASNSESTYYRVPVTCATASVEATFTEGGTVTIEVNRGEEGNTAAVNVRDDAELFDHIDRA